MLALLAVLLLLAGCGAEAPTPPRPLRILLVNDDGWNAPGIVALREGLRRAGHTVVEVAPDADRSDSGTAMTLTGNVPLTVLTPSRDLWSVRGTPSDAALIGLKAVTDAARPDLVVSGIDDRANVSLAAMSSGTVGAAMTAVSLGWPAVAVSTDLATPRPAPADFGPTVAFTVRLVDELSRHSDRPILPDSTVLNVNYPAGRAPARGVVAARTSNVPAVTVGYRYDGARRAMVPILAANPPSRDDVDVAVLRRGEVSLSDLSADPDRGEPPPRTAIRLAPYLRP